jgi:hypothetical protein
MLDMGLVGFIPIMALHVGIFVTMWRVFADRTLPGVAVAAGGAGLACIAVLMVTALGSQTFYPSQSTVAHWCLWAMGLRVWVERRRARQRAATMIEAQAVRRGAAVAPVSGHAYAPPAVHAKADYR